MVGRSRSSKVGDFSQKIFNDVDQLQEVRIPYSKLVVQFPLTIFLTIVNAQQIRQTYIPKFISASRIRFILKRQRRITHLVEPCDIVSRLRVIVRRQSGTVNTSLMLRNYVVGIFIVCFPSSLTIIR